MQYEVRKGERGSETYGQERMETTVMPMMIADLTR